MGADEAGPRVYRGTDQSASPRTLRFVRLDVDENLLQGAPDAEGLFQESIDHLRPAREVRSARVRVGALPATTRPFAGFGAEIEC